MIDQEDWLGGTAAPVETPRNRGGRKRTRRGGFRGIKRTIGAQNDE